MIDMTNLRGVVESEAAAAVTKLRSLPEINPTGMIRVPTILKSLSFGMVNQAFPNKGTRVFFLVSTSFDEDIVAIPAGYAWVGCCPASVTIEYWEKGPGTYFKFRVYLSRKYRGAEKEPVRIEAVGARVLRVNGVNLIDGYHYDLLGSGNPLIPDAVPSMGLGESEDEWWKRITEGTHKRSGVRPSLAVYEGYVHNASRPPLYYSDRTNRWHWGETVTII